MGPRPRAARELRAPRLACRELVELLSDRLEDALPAAQSERVGAHLDTCAACRAYLAQLRTTIVVLGRLREQDSARPSVRPAG